jgi:hypothetical protein
MFMSLLAWFYILIMVSLKYSQILDQVEKNVSVYDISITEKEVQFEKLDCDTL